MNKFIAIGFTGNYVERDKIRRYYANLARRGYPVTFFHPLRVVGRNLGEGIEGSGDELVSKLLALGTLGNDAKSFAKRFEVLASSFLSPGTHVRIVLHTDYAAPFWCSEKFQEAYLRVLPSLMEHISAVSHKHNLYAEVIVELHPGFTSVSRCRVRAGRLRCNVIERDAKKLSQCISLFRQKLLERTSMEPKFCIEPRAGSIVQRGGRKAESQTLSTHEAAYRFAKDNDLGLVVDPGQTVFKKTDINKAWMEALRVTTTDPAIVEEIHVHSPAARKGRGHGTPSPAELDKFRELAEIALRGRTRPLGLVLEILNAATDDLIRIAEELLKI